MKKTFTAGLLSIIVCVLFGSGLFAQDTKGDKVTVQITREGKVISDTTFQLKEGQDPEAVKKVIGHVLEGDLQVITEKEGHQKMVWVTSEDDKQMWHAEDVDVRMDSVGRHEEKVMVFKGDHPGEMHHKVIVTKEPGGAETITVISGDELEISEEEGEDNVEVYIIKTDDGTKVVKKVKKVKVTVEEEDETGNKAEEHSWEPAPKPDKKKK